MNLSATVQDSTFSLIDADILTDFPDGIRSKLATYHSVRKALKHSEERTVWEQWLRRMNVLEVLNYLFYGPGITLFIILDVCVDLPFILLYIVEMETSSIAANIQPTGLFVERPAWIYFFCIILSFFNLLSFFTRTLTGIDPLKELFSWQTIIDVLTCIPFIASLGLQHGAYLFVPYFLRAFIVIKRIRRLMFIQIELKRHSKYSISSIPTMGLSERLVTLVCVILVILYVAMCSFEYVEAITSSTFFRWRSFPSLYLMIVTGATVGYGDITPNSNPGRVVVILFIIVTISVLPSLIGRVVETIRRQRQGGGVFEDKDSRFIVLFGAFRNFSKIIDIIDFFQSDPDLDKVKVVMVGPDKVSEELSALISLPTFKHRLFYLKGSALNEQDLQRAKVQYADAAFILSDRDDVPGEIEDEQNCLRIWSLKRFAQSTRVFSVSRTPQSLHFQKNADVVICISTVKSVLLAFSCLNPGASTFVTNLMNAFNPKLRAGKQWVMEYNDGSCNEMYTCSVADCLKGFLFYNLAPYVYEHYQIILMGVRIWSTEHHKFLIFLNPYDYRPKLEDEFIVLAQNPQDVHDLEQIDLEYFCRTYKEPSTILPQSEVHEPNVGFSVVSNMYVYDVPPRPSTSSKRAICHLLPNSLPLQDRVIESVTSISGHILVIPRDYDLVACMTVLRSAILQKSEFFDVVVLSNRLPTNEEYGFLDRFPRMSIVVGNPRKMEDLMRAGALVCSKVLIFRQTETINQPVRDFDDAPSLLIKHSVSIIWEEHHVKPKPVFVELHERRNVKYLGSESIRQTNIMQKQRLKKGKKEEIPYTSIEEVAHDPVFAAGHVMIDNMLDNIVFHSYKGSHAFDLVQTLCGIRLQEDLEIGKELGISNGYMYKEPVPMEHWGQTFLEFLRYSLIEHKQLPVAIYRPPDSLRGNSLPYIYTSPVPLIRLKRGDEIFFIGRR